MSADEKKAAVVGARTGSKDASRMIDEEHDDGSSLSDSEVQNQKGFGSPSLSLNLT